MMTKELQDLDGDPVERLTALMLGLGTLISEHPVWVRIALRDEAALPDDTRIRDRESRLTPSSVTPEDAANVSDNHYLP